MRVQLQNSLCLLQSVLSAHLILLLSETNTQKCTRCFFLNRTGCGTLPHECPAYCMPPQGEHQVLARQRRPCVDKSAASAADLQTTSTCLDRAHSLAVSAGNKELWLDAIETSKMTKEPLAKPDLAVRVAGMHMTLRSCCKLYSHSILRAIDA